MKNMKKMMVVAAGLAVIQMGAYAQSSVTLYGVVDTSLRYTTNANAAGSSKIEVNAGSLQGNRWGLRGVEDLGGGLSTIFVLESGFNVDTGALGQNGLLFGRQAYLGLDGKLGTITLGRQYSIGFDTMLRFAPLGYSNTNEAEILAPYKNAGGSVTGSRQNNLFKYRAKLDGGMSASFAYAPGEVAGSNKEGSSMGASLGYAKGPLALAAFVQENQAGGTNTGGYRTMAGMGSYTFGEATLSLGYLDNKSKMIDNTHDKVIFSNLTYRVGPAVTMMVSAAQDRQSPTNGKRTTLAGQVTYAFSKRSNVYVEMDHNKWSGNFKTLADGGMAAPSPLINSKFGMAVGLRHSF